jgi:hypothetical protein
MKTRTSNQVIGILILCGTLFSFLGSWGAGPSHVQETPAITGFGTGGNFTYNGTMIILVYDDQLGFPHELQNGEIYHYNTVYMQYVQGLGSYEGYITVDQYITAMGNVTVHGANNTTYTVQEPVKVDQQISQVSFFVNARTSGIKAIPLPVSSQEKQVSITMDGVTFTFYHKSIPQVNTIPFASSPLAAWLVSIVFIGAAFIIAFSMSVLTLKRVIYVPPVGPATWSLVFIGILGAAVLFLYAFYYEIPFVPWWSYLIPLFFVAYFAILEKLANLKGYTSIKSAYLFGVSSGGGGTQEGSIHRKRIYVSDFGKKDFKIPENEKLSGWIILDPDSRLEALKRLFGVYKPITFKEGPRPWIFDSGPADDFKKDDKYFIFTDPSDPRGFDVREEGKTNLTEIGKKRIKIFLKKRGLDKRFHIPVSGHHYRHLVKFIEGYETVSEIGKVMDAQEIRINQLEVLEKISYITKRGDKNDITAMELAKVIYPGDPEIAELERKLREKLNPRPPEGSQGSQDKKGEGKND